MTDEEFKTFEKFIEHESKNAMDHFLYQEILAHGDDEKEVEFFNNIKKSKFFTSLFERGFIEGINFAKKLEKTTLVL